MTDKKLSYQERRQQIKHLIEEIGLWNINKTQLAERYKVSRETIYKDIENIIKGIPPEQLEIISFELSNAYKQAIKETRKIIYATSDPETKIKAANTIGKLGEQFTKMLESYGLKEVVADRIQVSGYDVRWMTSEDVKKTSKKNLE